MTRPAGRLAKPGAGSFIPPDEPRREAALISFGLPVVPNHRHPASPIVLPDEETPDFAQTPQNQPETPQIQHEPHFKLVNSLLELGISIPVQAIHKLRYLIRGGN